MNKQSGMSLIEILVAGGILAGLSLSIVKIQSLSIQTSKDVEYNSEIQLITSHIQGLLSNQKHCTMTFQGKDPKMTKNAVSSIGYINHAGNNQERFIKNKSYGSQLTITDYTLSDALDTANVDLQNTTNLVITFHKGKQGIRKEITRRILLSVITKAGSIESCRSLSPISDGPWLRSEKSAEDIFFDEGRVGIGSREPKAKLDVLSKVDTAVNIGGENCSYSPPSCKCNTDFGFFDRNSDGKINSGECFASSIIAQGNISAAYPFKNEHVATKGYVDALGGGSCVHIKESSCPSGYNRIGSSLRHLKTSVSCMYSGDWHRCFVSYVTAKGTVIKGNACKGNSPGSCSTTYNYSAGDYGSVCCKN